VPTTASSVVDHDRMSRYAKSPAPSAVQSVLRERSPAPSVARSIQPERTPAASIAHSFKQAERTPAPSVRSFKPASVLSKVSKQESSAKGTPIHINVQPPVST